jgi:hypothetical protein
MAGKKSEYCSTDLTRIIKTVQNDNPCIISFCVNPQRGFINPILNFNHVCVFYISILLSVGSQKCSLLSHLETCVSTHPRIALWTPEFWNCFCVCGRTYMALNTYIAWPRVFCELSQILLGFSWMGLVFLVLQSVVKAPFPSLVLSPSLMSV